MTANLDIVTRVIQDGLNAHSKDRKKSTSLIDRCVCSAVSLSHDKHQAVMITKMLNAAELLR